ncbi:hypothetical protein ABGB18_12100 [Nonomuraea sp. B12E4]|uniref:hypothetical protein n=1 Tax=Nonomuraea sp. B12E4 TaxID=3153564 RepID=UPI00325C86E8
MHALIPVLYLAVVMGGLTYLGYCARHPYVLCRSRTCTPAACPVCHGTGIRLRLIWRLRRRTHCDQ